MQHLRSDLNLRDLLNKYDMCGPRYTSYPTALHFDSAFSELDYLRHVDESNQYLVPKPLSLYIHIPFCHSLCYYCGCNKVVTHKSNAAETYLEALFEEIEIKGQQFAGDRLVQQIHFGGGTPTYLSNAQIREILEAAAQSFHLGLPDELEIGIEIDPREVDEDKLKGLIRLGINRVSVGVQDFDPEVQKAINRIQSEESVKQVLDISKSAGVDSVSFDLIYGLPKQTKQTLLQSIERVVDLKPDRIALYNYAHMPQTISAQRLILSEDLPSPSEKIDMLISSIEKLKAAGYVYIGMDHFALPSDSLCKAMDNAKLQRNFQGYSTHAECDIVGLGVSAISRINHSYSQNEVKLSNYKERLAKAQLPINKGLSLSNDDRIRASIIQQLMCSGDVNFQEVEYEWNIDFGHYFGSELDRLNTFANDQLVKLSESDIRVTDIGKLFLRNIAMVFDAYFHQASMHAGSSNRYSRTV